MEQASKDIVIDSYNKLKNAYLHANTFSKKEKLAYDLILFEELININFKDINIDYEWKKDLEIDDIVNNIDDGLLEHLSLNRELFYEISSNVINNFINSKYSLYDKYNKLTYEYMPNINVGYIKEIVASFLKEYDSNSYSLIMDMTKEATIIENNEEEYAGAVFNFPSIEKIYMTYSNMCGNNLTKVASYVHECGHIYEFMINNNSKLIDNFKRINMTPYYEISSMFFEYAFIMYLKEHGIYEEKANLYLQSYFLELFKLNYEINAITRKSNTIDSCGYIHVDESFSKDRLILSKKLNFYDLPTDILDKPIRDSFLYGIGGIMSIHLYDKYLIDKDKFKEQFRNSLLNYPLLNSLSAFSNLNIDNDVLKNSNKLEKVLRKV